MKKGQKIVIGMMGILALCILFLWNIRTIIHLFYISPSEPPSIENIQSANPINFDVAADQVGNIHLVWANKGREKPTYQKSTDRGKSWICIKELTDFNQGVENIPKVISVNDRLVLLWPENGNLYQQISSDTGNTWSSTDTVMICPQPQDTQIFKGDTVESNIYYDSVAITHSVVRIFKAISQNGSIYIVYSNYDQYDTYFARSDDYGYSWTRPIKLFAGSVWSSDNDQLEVQINNKNIHILYRKQLYDFSNVTPIYYLRSTDNGVTWDDLGEFCSHIKGLNERCFIDSAYLFPRFVADDNKLQLVLSYGNFYYIFSTDNGSNWYTPNSLGFGYPEEYSLFLNNTGQLIIPFITNKHQEKDWWGYIPEIVRSVLFIWAYPYWDNNDLYCAFVKDGKLVRSKRLTHQLSYVQRKPIFHYTSFTCLQVGKNPMIFWAGKRKAGKSLGDYPYEIFYKTVAE
jgi:hypothetical protein